MNDVVQFLPEGGHSSIAFGDGGKTYRIEVSKADHNSECMIEVTDCVLSPQSGDGGDFVELERFDDVVAGELYAN
jgi:hypothetical protein